MDFAIRRIILFARDVDRVARFYMHAFGLARTDDGKDSGWAELDAGACRLAIHAVREDPGSSSHLWAKIVFYAADVAAARAELDARGVAMGPIHTFGSISICDGADPEGNRFQISSRP